MIISIDLVVINHSYLFDACTLFLLPYFHCFAVLTQSSPNMVYNTVPLFCAKYIDTPFVFCLACRLIYVVLTKPEHLHQTTWYSTLIENTVLTRLNGFIYSLLLISSFLFSRSSVGLLGQLVVQI